MNEQPASTPRVPPKRRPVLGVLSIFLLFFLYRVFTVYTVRSGECRPKPIDPSLRRLTRTENGQFVSYPDRAGYPVQTKPLLVLSYNIEGHDELIHSDHIEKIAATINALHPDIVGLQEVHRKTWQSRFRDQVDELARRTGLHVYYGSSYEQWGGQFGNALLTRGEIVSAETHKLPSVGEPRSIIESVVKIDGAMLNVYVTHLTTWGKFNRASRREQLQCVAEHVRSSRYPYLLLGDFNAPPETPEVSEFRGAHVAQLCGEDIGITHPMMNQRIDYIWADYGWEIRAARAIATGSSDHYPITAELFWNRNPQSPQLQPLR